MMLWKQLSRHYASMDSIRYLNRLHIRVGHQTNQNLVSTCSFCHHTSVQSERKRYSMRTFTRSFCVRGNWCPEQDDGICENCHFYTTMDVPVEVVYRPHRRAVTQSIHRRRGMGYWDWAPTVVVKARLGHPSAVAQLRYRRRVRNGTRLGRWSWARKARAANYNQALLAIPWAGDIFRRRMCSLTG